MTGMLAVPNGGAAGSHVTGSGGGFRRTGSDGVIGNMSSTPAVTSLTTAAGNGRVGNQFPPPEIQVTEN